MSRIKISLSREDLGILLLIVLGAIFCLSLLFTPVAITNHYPEYDWARPIPMFIIATPIFYSWFDDWVGQ